MNKELLKTLNTGLYLESCDQLIVWGTPFEKLKQLGNPETRQISDQRVDLIWKEEKILNGLSVDLTVARWFGLARKNRKFNQAFANIRSAEIENTLKKLNSELGHNAKYEELNSLEYSYTWELEQCKIKFIQSDRFGPNWSMNIQGKKNWLGPLKRKWGS